MPGIAQSITTTRGLSSAASAIGFVAVAGFADDGDRRVVFEHAAEAAAHQAVIVDQQDGDLIRHARPSLGVCSGTRSRTSVPPSRGRRNSSVPPTSSARSRMATRPRPRRCASRRRSPCRDLRLPARARPASKRSRTHACVGAGMPRDVVQRFLQHAIDVNADGHVDRRRQRRRARRRRAMPGLPLDRRQIPVDRALEARLLEDRRVQRLRQAAHVVERRLRDLADSRAARRAAASPPAPACRRGRSIEPIAVRIWPNSSCSSREMWRSVDSLRRRSAAAPARCAASESAASCANSRRFERIRYRLVSSDRDAASRRGTSRPAAAPGRRCPGRAAAVCSSLSLFCDQQPRDRRARAPPGAPAATAGSARAPRPRGRRAPARRCDPTASQNCASELARYWRCSGVRRATRQLLLAPQRVVEIGADALELRRPGGQRIGLVAVEHVAHGQAERS